MEKENAPKKMLQSPEAILGLGCLLVLTMAAVGAGVLGWLGHEMLAANNDPIQRANIARQILATQKLPEGLHPVVAMSMKGTMELVVLSDEPFLPTDHVGHFANEGFFFMRVLGASMGAMPGEFENEFLNGQEKSENNDLIMPAMADGRIYQSGNFQLSGAPAKFVSLRGTLEIFGWRGPGLQNRFSIRCSEIATPVLGIWFMKDALGDANYETTPLNLPALQKRLEGIDFCPTQNP